MKLTDKDFQEAATALNCEVAAIRAVCEVEAPRGGFNPDGTPVTLFEGHKFYKYTDGRFTIDAPDLSYRNWTKAHYGKTWQQEQDRLNRAKALDHDAALMSASWGKFQIMGFNYESAGFETVRMFVNAMYIGERAHLMAFVNFVKSNPKMWTALRDLDFATFARWFNGASYAENKYDTKMASAYAKFKDAPEPVATAPQLTSSLFERILKMILSLLKR